MTVVAERNAVDTVKSVVIARSSLAMAKAVADTKIVRPAMMSGLLVPWRPDQRRSPVRRSLLSQRCPSQ
jgi:hypothetical protein